MGELPLYFHHPFHIPSDIHEHRTWFFSCLSLQHQVRFYVGRTLSLVCYSVMVVYRFSLTVTMVAQSWGIYFFHFVASVHIIGKRSRGFAADEQWSHLPQLSNVHTFVSLTRRAGCTCKYKRMGNMSFLESCLRLQAIILRIFVSFHLFAINTASAKTSNTADCWRLQKLFLISFNSKYDFIRSRHS